MTASTGFADRLAVSIERSGSYIVAGMDPRIEDLPDCFLEELKAAPDKRSVIRDTLVRFYGQALESLTGVIAAIKPNIAFFEQYGLYGLEAFCRIVHLAKDRGIPVVADAKRGDIGTTAAAYSASFLGRASLFGEKLSIIDADALTVNPFLGFDTLEPFLKDCAEYGKGIFVLVKTSNPGSADIQGAIAGAQNVSEKIASFVSEKGKGLTGSCGYSGLGAVVGATYPGEAKALRALMPNNFFLIPGMGAQGGSAKDAVAGFASRRTPGGAIINLSRGLFSAAGFKGSDAEWSVELKSRAAKFNREISEALT